MGRGDEELRWLAIERRAAGATIEQIKRELGVGSTRLARLLVGVSAPPRPRLSDQPEFWSDRRREA